MNRKASVFIVLLVFFMSVYSALAYYVTTPKPNQPFMGFGVFSRQGLSGYLPGSNGTVSINEPVSWQLNITNEMGSVQFVQVVSRIGNLTSAPPSATSPAASIPLLSNSTLFVADGETGAVYFTWTILSTFSSGGLNFLKVDVNGQQFTSSVGASSGKPFRLFFELWTFSASSGFFQYGWPDGGSRVGSWLQVWFTVSP